MAEKLAHRYGGPWTEVKLGAVQYYLECYTRALSKKFTLWYIDGFAGTGSREIDAETGGLLEGKPLATETQSLEGSALRALGVDPMFDRFVFIESDAERAAVLEQLRQSHAGRRIDVRRGDANEELRRLVGGEPWSNPRHRNRGVVFLDPYALQLDWETLRALAHTQALDVWYLFPLRDMVRQLAHRHSGIGPKDRMLDRFVGPSWRDLYSLPKPETSSPDLFGTVDDELRRNADVSTIERWVRTRMMQDLQFPYVSEPLPILTSPGRQAFSLFLAVSNPSRSAIELAEYFATHVRRKHAPRASRQRSSR